MHKLNKSKKHRMSRTYLGLGLITAPAVVSGAILSASYAFADDPVIDVVSIDVPISCNVSATGKNSHTATVANGVYTSNIGTTSMNIICNDNGGFSVYATGYTGGVSGETNSNKLVGTSASGNATIITGTATGPGSTDVSNWAMKLATDSNADYPITILDNYDSYHTVPNSYTKVATRTSGTDAGNNATGSTLTSTYAAYFSRTQATDVYTGQVKYTLVHPHNAPTPVALYLQNTTAIAAAVPNIGDTVTATDIRDGLDYTVGKLADGNIWLLDNLAIDLTMPNASTKITAANTNASATSLNALFNGVTGGGQDGNLAHEAVIADSGKNWTGSYTRPVINPSFRDQTPSEISSALSGPGDDVLVGTYYNYCAASAGSYCYDDESGGSAPTESICPKGWSLTSMDDYYDLDDYYEDDYYHELEYDKLFAALRPSLAGYNYPSADSGIGSYAVLWSSDISGYTDVNAAEFNDFYQYYWSGNTYGRPYGLSVRCIMDTN